MLKASEKEYEVLKEEISELKSCITRYNGYIISVFGASGIFIKFLLDEKFSSNTILLIITLTILIITLLFDLIWYKFKSHNRYVGYAQLLSQEVSHHSYEKTKKHFGDKSYLDKIQNVEELSSDKAPEWNLYSWEFMMARLNNANFHKAKNTVLTATDKVRFVFKIPSSYSYLYLGTLDYQYKKLDRFFFDKVIHELYRADEATYALFPKFFNLIRVVSKYFNLLKYLYTPIKTKSFSANTIKIDGKYRSSGWLYARKVTQIAHILLFLFLALFIYIFIKDFEFAFSKEVLISPFFKPIIFVEGLANLHLYLWNPPMIYNWIKGAQLTLIYPPIAFFLVIGIYLFWIKRYLYGISKLISGDGSIEFYCWTFFLFRVQYLNANNIIPVYFSRGFIRFFKSRYILASLQQNENDFLAEDPQECIVCKYMQHVKKQVAKKKNKDVLTSKVKEKQSKYGHEFLLKEEANKKDGIKIFCNKHLTAYKDHIGNLQSLPQKFRKAHEVINAKVKSDHKKYKQKLEGSQPINDVNSKDYAYKFTYL